MTIFAILMPTPQSAVIAKIREIFPNDHLMVSDTQYLVSSTGTAIEVCAKLGIYDLKLPNAPSTGNAIVFATSSYFGRAPSSIWDWLKAKLEAPPNG
jgi:hypothetical protein